MLSRALAMCAVCAVVLQITAVSADQATADLIPGPPDANWQLSTTNSGPKTAVDIYGSKAGSVRGFVDAYERVWSHAPDQGLADRLEHFSSAFWASFRFSDSRTAARKNKNHSSFRDITGVGMEAYEVTDPADAQGFQTNTLVLTKGDYFAVTAIASQATPDDSALLDQATRQGTLIPVPTGEYQAIGNGVITTIVVIAIAAGLISIIVAAIVLVVVMRRRRRNAVVPPGAPISPDGAYWWDGTTWRPRPPG